MAVFLALVIAIGWFLSYYYGNPNILYFFVIFSVLLNIFAYWNSDKVVIKLSGAKPASREEYFDLYTAVENLSITAGLPLPKIYIINDPAPNAFATGRDKKHAVVAVTSGLLAILDKNELEGVIGHELSHIGNRDMLLSTVVVVLVGFVTIAADVFIRGQFFGIRGRAREGEGNAGGIIMLIGIIFLVLSPIFAALMQLAISRKREFLADASGALLTRYPEGLANALRKISDYARPMRKQSSAIAHLYIADPRPGLKKKISGLFSTHPPIDERIKALVGK